MDDDEGDANSNPYKMFYSMTCFRYGLYFL